MKFKYTPEELKILKNFGTINDNIIIQPDQFAVINGAKKSVVGFYKFENVYDHEPYGIFNLREFITLLEIDSGDYELEVHDKYVQVTYASSKSSTKYNLTPQELLPTVGSISEKFNSLQTELEFELSGENIATLKKVTNVLALERIYFQIVETPTKNVLLITATNKSLENAVNPYIITLENQKTMGMEPTLILYVNVEELKIMEGDYDVQISAKGISRWWNKFQNVEYFIGVNTLETEWNK